MIANLWRRVRGKQSYIPTRYESRYDYLQACYNHLVRYHASEQSKQQFLRYAYGVSELASDDTLINQCNRMLDYAGMP